MKKIGQKGFTLVEGLLVIIALSLVVGVGYYVYNSGKNESPKAATTAVNSRENTQNATAAKKYLKIPELGIKFELTDKLKNAYYAKVDGYYYVSVRDLGDNCQAGGPDNNLGLMAINVGKLGEPNTAIASGTPWTQQELDESGYKKLGDTYYGFVHGNGPCYDPTAADAEQTANLTSDYMQAFVAQQSTIQKL